ncbi:MAG: hypothetical protein LBI78_05565 [Campylobacteraceae bacterium]|nr:hypothetical protein [Campylobacteraceae bacterium]
MILTIFSFIYGPLVVWLTDSFSVKTSSTIILIVSIALIVLTYKKKSSVWVIPLVYFVISLSTLIFGKTVLMQFAPLAISLGVALLLSMKYKTSFMIQNGLDHWYFLKQKQITREQISSSVWIWATAAWINVFLHTVFLIFMSKWFWAFYVSAGWYAVFVSAAVFHIYMWRRKKKDKS